MSLSAKVFIGLGSGIVAGLFFGEMVSPLAVFGQAFILLLQMTVLPYVAFSLVRALGSLKLEQAKVLVRYAGIALGLLWTMALTTVIIIPLSFPDWESASFFSSSLVESSAGFDFLGLFIPANPFRALADSTVPAVVVFSVAVGIALIFIERKDVLLEMLTTLTDALGSITGFVVSLAPYGVFAIAANAAGTMDLAEIGGVQVYVVAFIAAALLLSLWTLPVLVTTVTPLKYRDVVGFTRDALVTAFATGNVFVVLPVLSDKSKELLKRIDQSSEKTESVVDVIVPTSYNFPSSGKLLSLSFIPFAGWLSGFSLSLAQFPLLLVGGLFTYFGSNLVAIPFLLDLFRIPADTFQLFVLVDNVIGNRFAALLAATHILALTMLSACAMAGCVKFETRRLLRFVVITLALGLVTVFGVRAAFDAAGHEYEMYQVFIERPLLLQAVESREIQDPPDPLPAEDLSRPVLDRIRERGAVRIGYAQDALPWVFRNDAGALVGFDVEMGHQLARELGVTAEFIRCPQGTIPDLLEAGYLDVAMTGMAITPTRMQQMKFSEPYVEETAAFVVKDHLREKFSTRKAVQKQAGLKIGVPRDPYYREKLANYLPEAEFVIVDSPRGYFRGEMEELDGLLFGAATGSSWSLIYPAFTIAVPHPDVLGVPLAYGVARREGEMEDYLSRWIELKKKDITIQRLTDYWIMGKSTETKSPRWSILRDVLGWM